MTTTYVCSYKDIECGSKPENWCSKCPLKLRTNEPKGAAMSDVQCPYCHHEFEVCHDDGHGLDESTRWEESCPECEKRFVFTTCFTVSHSGYKADCLNGGDHDLKLSNTYPKKFSKMGCKDCDFERQPTKEECPEVYL